MQEVGVNFSYLGVAVVVENISFASSLRGERFNTSRRRPYNLESDRSEIQLSFLLVGCVILGNVFDLCKALLYIENGGSNAYLNGQCIN